MAHSNELGIDIAVCDKSWIRYNIGTGVVMENKVEDYHIIESDGLFKMAQILESEFKASNLNKFDQNSGSSSSSNLIFGRSGDMI